MFDYDQRGILDSTHLRFFTRRSLVKLVERRGFAITRIEPVGLPLDALGVEGTGRARSDSLIASCRTCGPRCSGTSSSSSRHPSEPELELRPLEGFRLSSACGPPDTALASGDDRRNCARFAVLRLWPGSPCQCSSPVRQVLPGAGLATVDPSCVAAERRVVIPR